MVTLESVVCDEEEPVWRAGQRGFGTCLAGGLGSTEQSCWDSRDAVGDFTVTRQSSISKVSVQVAMSPGPECGRSKQGSPCEAREPQGTAEAKGEEWSAESRITRD